MSLFGSFWKKDSGNSRKASSVGKWQVGDKIENLYEVYQILGGKGKSGMGIVYICAYKDKTCALKTFQDKEDLLSEESQKIFERECLVWTKLESHPYIVRAHWVERLEGRLFIVLEYIVPDNQGRNTLTHYLDSLTFSDILKFSIQFCYGMEYAYSKGIDAHRDIKPDNIMITADKTAKITDFGLAKAFQEIQLKEDIISSSGKTGLSIFQTKGGKRACGTLQYMAPEQFDGYADKRSDIYAFGITLYQMVTGGRLPFIGRGRTEQEIQKDYERLHKYEKVPVISSQPFPIIQECLEKNPENRFQDFSTIKEELQRFLLQETGEKISQPEAEELDADGWTNKGIALSNLGRYQEALICHDKAIEIDPKLASAWNNKGYEMRCLHQYKQAILCYEKALELDPAYAMAWNNKGIDLQNLGRYQEALICHDKAIDIDPQYAGAWQDKGVALHKLGRYEEASICYDKALELYPDFILAHDNKRICTQKLIRSRKQKRKPLF